MKDTGRAKEFQLFREKPVATSRKREMAGEEYRIRSMMRPKKHVRAESLEFAFQ
jgi:hypothetical protein